MLLLHLSDIHFRTGIAGTAMDPDLSLRNEIVNDAINMCATLGSVDAILISGDIAYSGQPDEYRFASEWIRHLAREVDCDGTSVFICPGNHDVDRQHARRAVIHALHDQIRAGGPNSYLEVLPRLLTDVDTRAMLYEPLKSYNNFAVQYFCDLLPPERTIARRDLHLNDGSILRLSGLNSALVSSDLDSLGNLFVDPACFQLLRKPGVEHLVMCHHPFHWLNAGERLKDHLDSFSRVQLFGHDHRQRIELGRDLVRIAAGATHPDRREEGWEPGYNLIQVEVEGSSVARRLEVKVHVRVWQDSPARFSAKIDSTGDVFFRNSIPLPAWSAPDRSSAESINITNPVSEASTMAQEGKLEQADPLISVRELSLRFFELTFSQKNEIAGKLELLEEEDIYQPDFERFRQVFLRARDRGLIEELDQEVRAVESRRI